MFAHISIGVNNIENSVGFYDNVMEALGYKRLFGDVDEKFMAYGPDESFFIINEPLDESKRAQACNGSHICIKAKKKEDVDLFHKTTLKLGAQCDGPPGFRKHYVDDYYAAFILDPDGHKIEAMTRVG